MTPHLGQGACQAIEDAVVLASVAGTGTGAGTGSGTGPDLAAYTSARMRRTRMLATGSYRASPAHRDYFPGRHRPAEHRDLAGRAHRTRDHGPPAGPDSGLDTARPGARTAGPVPVTTKRSNIPCVNGDVPTAIIVAGLVLAGYALLMTALNRRMGIGLLVALGVLEILLLVQVGLVVAKLAGGGRPAGGVAVLIGYLIAMPLVPAAAAFWGLLERSRWGPAVIAVAGLVAAVLMVRLHEIWPVIHV